MTKPERPDLEKCLVDPDGDYSVHCPKGENDCCNGCFDADKAARYALHLEAKLAKAEKERAQILKECDPFLKRLAHALADEVAVLVRRKVIDARSPAGDALLDYRNPPMTDRSDRIAELETKLAGAEAEVQRLRRGIVEQKGGVPAIVHDSIWTDGYKKGRASHS